MKILSMSELMLKIVILKSIEQLEKIDSVEAFLKQRYDVLSTRKEAFTNLQEYLVESLYLQT